MNNQYPYNNQYQQPMQQYYGQSPATKQKKDSFLSKNLFSLLICAGGIASIIIGIAAIATCGTIYAHVGSTDAVLSTANGSNTTIHGGLSPVVSLIFAILALLLGAGATVFGIIYGNKQASKGNSRGTSTVIGVAAGIAGVILCVFAIATTSCSTCSYCSEKKVTQDQVNQRNELMNQYNSLR